MKPLRFPNEMSKEGYDRLFAPFVKGKYGRNLLKWINLICAGIFYLAYPVCLVILLIGKDSRIVAVVLIPAISFVVLSIFRKLINRPRPYETLGITPLLKKESKGASFPSRHIFSAFLIAATIVTLTPWGYLLYLPAVLLAIVRVVGGVHYPSDAIAGVVCAGLAALFYLV